ncbi:hypothetical protein [Streptomyces sp. 2231.1]|uniref:hypothetical protein n=1 Tax=Streptomyces sp. 2231.1 TaxID=1855347 RepID=UPI00115FCD9F|nr:hypothetical protein [Streptomyces sp. 2231.1]
MSRSISGLVLIHGVDDENWPWADEPIDYQHSVHIVLDQGQPAARVGIPPVRWGGECRFELDLTAQVIDARGNSQLRGVAKLFEGDSEDTTDLEDEKSFELFVPRGGRPSATTVTLNNSGLGGGDWATVQLSFTNSLFEESDE